jgi:hypothetical protein
MQHVVKGWLVGAPALLAVLAMPAVSSAGVKQFVAVLNGAQEIPANASTATGLAHLSFDTATKNLCFAITHTVAGEILAHIHGPDLPQGNGGMTAGVVVTLPVGASKTGCVLNPGAPFNKADLFKNLYYINIHSGAFPAGEIRGQILRIK